MLSEKKKFSFFGMSGSGSSIFFNFDKISSERSVIQLIKQKFPLVRIEKSYYFG
jgi:4-diphosphocytidyl-2C-methyl-D-erythritol kinase